MRRLILAGVTAIILVLVGTFFINQAQAAALDLTGYGWSSNIGWINFNPDGVTGGSGVVLSDPDGSNPNRRYFNGYAWSNNIGWIKFDRNLTGFDGSGVGAYLDTTTTLVSGWARACSILLTSCSGTTMIADNLRGGWDGWIKFGGVAGGTQDVRINLATGIGSGKAWGSEVVGWIDFDKLRVGTTVTQNASVTLTANPTSVTQSGAQTQLTWTPVNVTSCTASGGWSGAKLITGGTEGATVTTNPTVFNISCVPVGGGTNVTAQVSVSINTISCSNPPCGGGGDDTDKTLRITVVSDTTAPGRVTPSPSGGGSACTTGTCTYTYSNNTGVMLTAQLIGSANSAASIAWGGDVPASCDPEVEDSSDTCSITMDKSRNVTVYFNDDNIDEGGAVSVSYPNSLLPRIQAVGINVGGTNQPESFSSTAAQVSWSAPGVTSATVSTNLGLLGDIALDNGCEVPTTPLPSTINSGAGLPVRVVFPDRCSNTPTVASYYSVDNTGTTFPIKLTFTWLGSNGTNHSRVVTIPLQYIETFTQQP